jgi:PAS domain S-box-containing protein
VATGRELQLEHRVVRPDGETVWVSHSSIPVQDADGTVVGHLATVTDVSALKAAEQASEDARRRLAAMVEHWPGAAYMQDLDGRFLLLNSEAAGAFGEAPETLLGADAAAVMPPSQVHDMHRRDERVRAGEVVRFEPTLVDPDGVERTFLTTKFPVLDADGVVAAMGSHAIDITDRKGMEAALRDAEERFRQAFEDAPIGIALINLDGRVLQVNQALCELTGYSAEQLDRTSWHALVHPDDVDEDVAAIAALLQDRLRTHHREERLLHAAGEPVWASLHLTLVRAADGTPRHLLAQVQDITERKRFEGRLQHMADHDPLTGLLNRRRFEEELDRQVATVQRYGARGALLVLDLDHFKLVNAGAPACSCRSSAARRSPTHSGTCRIVACCSSAPAIRSTRA